MEKVETNLKEQRIKLSITLEQVVEKTRIRKDFIEQIELNDTDSIPLVYLNAYKKTLNDFYNKAANNQLYLSAVKSFVVDNQNINTYSFQKEALVYNREEKKENLNILDTTVTTNFEAPKLNKNNKKNIIIKNDNNIDNKKNIKEKKEIIPEHIIEINKNEKPQNINKKYIKNSSINLNRKILKKTLNITIKDLLVYTCGAIIIGAMIFFVFIYDTNSKEIKNVNAINGTDNAISITTKENDIFSYFNNDSVVLLAKCNDSASVKVEIDNKKVYDILMAPGMNHIWSAEEKIILTTTNVGGIDFYKNDTLLPILGPKGTMVQNIIITKEGIKNVNQLSADNNYIPIKDLQPNQNEIVPSAFDTTKPLPPKQYIAKKKKEEAPKPIIIDFSKPALTKPPILENEKRTQE